MRLKSKERYSWGNYRTQTKQIEEFTEKQSGHEKELAELQNRISVYEKNDMKIRVAHEAGIPYELAGKLSGDDEEALRKDAENFLNLF